MNERAIFLALQQADQAFRAGDLARAEALYRQVLAMQPGNALAIHGMGVIAMRVGRPDVAVGLLIRSTAQLAANPLAHCALGDAHLALGRMEQAAESYRRALELQPGFPEALCNLGTALQELGRFEQAIECFRQASANAPEMLGPPNNLGNVLQLLGRYDEAIQAYQRAIAVAPNVAATQNHLATALMESGRIEEAISACRAALQLDPTASGAHSNLVAFLPCDPTIDAKSVFEEHRRWNDLHAKPLSQPAMPYRNDRNPDRRLRIGYVSPDWREHPISYFFDGLIAAHDPAQIETFCYADLQRPSNATDARAPQFASQTRNITGLSDARTAELIRSDQIDILVDLAGHTAANRLLVFARKPAPIQITYLGYPNTTGMDVIDYRLTDGLADPPGMTEHLHSEQLVRLPRTFACYRPREDVPPVNALPAKSNGFITFGSFNKLSKINSVVIECWAGILRQISSSKLMMMSQGLQDPPTAKRIQLAFEARGVSTDRLELRGSQDRAGFFAAHHQIDVMLDPFPVNGHTITCHSLWMGVPVVSLTGQTHVSRLGTSVLANLGLGELLATSTDHYVQIAVSLASDPSSLADYRAKLRQRMSESPLMDYRGFAREVESAYRDVWRRWCGADNLPT